MSDSVLGNKFNTISDAGKKIVLTPSLFMRLLEWSKEDAKDDIALHQVFEKIMAFTDGTNPVGIECYDALIKDATGSSLPKEEDEEVAQYDNGNYWCSDTNNYDYCCHGCDYEYDYPVDCSYPMQDDCCHTYTLDYNDVDTYYKPFGNDLLDQYDMKPTTIEIDCTKEVCPTCDAQPEENVYDAQIDDIIKLGQL